MRAKEYLMQLVKIEKLIENKLYQKSHWLAIATGTTSHMGGDRVQTSGNHQRMADAMDAYIDSEREIDAAVDSLVDTRREIVAKIEQLNATEYDILHKIYVQYKTLQDVADDYDKSYSWAATMHGIALKNLQKILDSES